MLRVFWGMLRGLVCAFIHMNCVRSAPKRALFLWGLACCALLGWATPCTAGQAADADRVFSGSESSDVPEAALYPATQMDGKGASPSVRNAGTLIVYFENDLFCGTDRYYTNAVRATAISPDLISWAESGDLPDSLDDAVMSLPFAGRTDALFNVSLSLGQEIYTPENTQIRALQKDDRPYAGFLYGSVGLHAKTGKRLDTLELTLGVVGPWSMAETAQNGIHRMRQIDTAKGWEHQLHNEPGMMVTWERTWRMNEALRNRGWEWDFLPYVGLTAGNVMTYASMGGEARYGWNVPSDFGTSLIRAGGGVSGPTEDRDPLVQGGWGCYAFVGTEARAVARNIFLDGNTFTNSHHVDKRYLVADFSAGLAVVFQGWRLAYTYVVRTEEFVGQNSMQHFGSLQLSYSF